MKDNYDDKIKVYADENVYVSFTKGAKFVDMSLTPANAIKLAEKILKAARGSL